VIIKSTIATFSRPTDFWSAALFWRYFGEAKSKPKNAEAGRFLVMTVITVKPEKVDNTLKRLGNGQAQALSSS